MSERANYFRRRRARIIARLIDEALASKAAIAILDVGGTVDYWKRLPELWRGRPVSITLINMVATVSDDPQIESLAGDACAMPQFADDQFDIVHSNSVIEHVGDDAAIARMAGEVRRLAPVHYLQTPNYYFPIEPHYKLPFLHWLPERARAEALRKIPGQLPPGADMVVAMKRVRGINLLTAAQMRSLFPDSRLLRERLAGFTKSLIAVRDRAPVPSRR